tara:strand:+ start:2905 stop:3417 length:513 start_codon:yes stop_codon:yes gene_type:complete
MTNYNSLDDVTREQLRQQINECAQSLGGKNYFLQLLEAIRAEGQHPLVAKDLSFRFNHGIVKWKKVIFKDKVHLLKKLLKNSETNGNLMPKKGEKNYKTIMNLLRTLGPMKFKIQPKNSNDGGGYILHPIDIIDENNSQINFMFEVVFFLPLYIVKKILIGPTKKETSTH